MGSSENLRIDARILTSINQNLDAKIKAGAFREDLFYRLNVLTVAGPNLAEWRQGIPQLALCFLRQTCGRDEDTAQGGRARSPRATWPVGPSRAACAKS